MGKIRSNWEENELATLVRLKRDGIGSEEIIRYLAEISGVVRTVASIHSKYHELNKSGRSDELLRLGFNSSEIREEQQRVGGFESEIYQRLQRYDEENVLEVLRKRDEFMYGLMAEQASAVRMVDSLAGYEGLRLEDLMALELSKRREVTKILENPPKPKVKEIPILYTRNSWNDFALVLPVYFVDVQGASSQGLASTINDSVVGFMFSETGRFKAKSTTQDRFKDLVRYNFEGQLNSDSFEKNVSDMVRKEHNKINKVYLLENRLVFLTRSEGD